jgi:hypothetical protein
MRRVADIVGVNALLTMEVPVMGILAISMGYMQRMIYWRQYD